MFENSRSNCWYPTKNKKEKKKLNIIDRCHSQVILPVIIALYIRQTLKSETLSGQTFFGCRLSVASSWPLKRPHFAVGKK